MGLTGASKTAAVMGVRDIEAAAELLKSLSNPQRLQIVCALTEGEQGVSDIERKLQIRQPSLSQHLASLREAGIIAGRREAKAVFYRISDARAVMFVEALHVIFSEPPRHGLRKSAPPAAVNQTLISTMTAAMQRTPYAGEAAFFARVGENAEV